MKRIWFRPWGWVFRPVSILGWCALALAVLFCAQVFLAVDQRSHSASDTLYEFFPYVSGMFLMLNWLASKTGGH
jgi:hypothetical protein